MVYNSVYSVYIINQYKNKNINWSTDKAADYFIIIAK